MLTPSHIPNPPIFTKTVQNTILEGVNPLLNMLRLFAKRILVRASILLPIPQHIRGPSLNHALQRTVSSHNASWMQRRK